MIKFIRNQLYLLKQFWLSLFFYPEIHLDETDYEKYWQARGLGRLLNSFQKKRADLILKEIKNQSSVIDIGGGDGRVLNYLKQHKPLGELTVVDTSAPALKVAVASGLKTIKADITNPDFFGKISLADYFVLFEVLEHIPHPEEIFIRALSLAKKGVFFSVPNSGFIAHRLRLLLGRFPLQWRISPWEHIRFWTVSDAHGWLKQLGVKSYRLKIYEGPAGLNWLWPSLFGRGLWVFVPATSAF